MDILTDVLNTLELKSSLYSRTEITAPWRFHFAASQDAIFHILNFGSGYICVEGEATPIPVNNGDVIVLPRGHAHAICDELTSPTLKSSKMDYDSHHGYQIFPFEGEGPKTVLLCGLFHFEHPNHFPLLQCLPNIIHIPGERGQMADGLADTLRLLANESASSRLGAEVILGRLTEILFLQIVRFWMEVQQPGTGGWLAALRDGPIGTALGLIHQAPEYRWKVEELANAVALSRSAFSTRFTLLVGETPVKYLTRWRMHLAMRLLRNEGNIQKIAQRLGYDSEVAFRKAFKREVGISPAQYRVNTGSRHNFPDRFH